MPLFHNTNDKMTGSAKTSTLAVARIPNQQKMPLPILYREDLPAKTLDERDPIPLP